jgi:hypothetical protein
MTPSPGTGPRDSDKGITTDVMRATMAATGGRNQRHIANLKTVSTKDQNESDSDDDVIICSLNEQKTISYHFGWSNEKDRLEKLVDLSDSMVMISEAEKMENKLALYNFLKRPPVVPEAILSTSSNRRKHNAQHTPTVQQNSTPASALVTTLSTVVQTEQLITHAEETIGSMDFSPFPVSIISKLSSIHKILLLIPIH